jgi:hypothetical protein
MLAAAYEDHELTRHWMAHHLAALVTAAEGEVGATVEQRTEIVDTILRVWAARRSFPGEVPAFELDLVFAALDMLGDDRPWRFSRLQNFAGNLRSAEDAEVPLVVTAINLERLTRQALLVLIWRACQDAVAKNEPWLEAAEAVGGEIEDELVASTRRVRRRLVDLTADEPWNPDVPGEKDKPEAHVLTLGLRAMSEQLALLANELDGDIATGGG